MVCVHLLDCHILLYLFVDVHAIMQHFINRMVAQWYPLLSSPSLSIRTTFYKTDFGHF